MFRFEPGLKVYLHREPVDGRKAINGLALLVEQSLGLDPFAPAVFVFSNRRRDRIKLLLWDRTRGAIKMCFGMNASNQKLVTVRPDLKSIKDLQPTDRIAELLGHCPYDEVVHRDNLVVLT